MADRYSKNLKPDGVFTVGESRGLAFALALVFAALFFYAVVDALLHPDGDRANRIMLVALIPAIIFLRKSRSRAVIMRIDSLGFTYYGKRLFTWPQFVSARVEEGDSTGRFQDNFKLHLQYYREDGNLYHRRVPLTNMQNKSEEEIIAAIRYYSNLAEEQ